MYLSDLDKRSDESIKVMRKIQKRLKKLEAKGFEVNESGTFINKDFCIVALLNFYNDDFCKLSLSDESYQEIFRFAHWLELFLGVHDGRRGQQGG